MQVESILASLLILWLNLEPMLFMCRLLLFLSAAKLRSLFILFFHFINPNNEAQIDYVHLALRLAALCNCSAPVKYNVICRHGIVK